MGHNSHVQSYSVHVRQRGRHRFTVLNSGAHTANHPLNSSCVCMYAFSQNLEEEEEEEEEDEAARDVGAPVT